MSNNRDKIKKYSCKTTKLELDSPSYGIVKISGLTIKFIQRRDNGGCG